MPPYFSSASIWIDAEPAALFEIVADPRNHAALDGSQSIRELFPGSPPRLYLGAKFGVQMSRKISYPMWNTVTEFVPGAIIAWKPWNGHTWRYTFTPHEGGTYVTEEWDCRGVWNRYVMKVLGIAKYNQRSIEKSLQRLAEYAQRT